ncbi:RAP protein, putative [Plasmodium reichenowi]|uniref:RAP protein, putative n=1 Tax=Plasmodium reichenowi TaxID=5854 RepID=A0A060RPT2_PLARE|nr:RAP protein, putative [Plasmodium reichenowi]
MKRYKILIKNVNTFKWKSYEVKRISSIILNSKKSKPFNIDYIEKVKKKNGLKDGCNKVFLKNKYNGEKYERDKNITRWCDKLNEYAKNKEYDVYENGLNSCSCIAENSIEISQLINVISKNKIINNNIMLIYIKLIDKCLKIFSNIPMRSVSLILNSMVKLNYYHTNFIDLFFKNINNIIDKSNPIDLSILYHFYVNCSGDYFEYINDNKNDIYLNLFLNKILNDISLLQIQAISCILRCNKKIIKRKNWEHEYFKNDGVLEENYLNVQVNEKNKTMDYNKGYEEKEIEKKRIQEGTYKRGIIYDDEKTYYNRLSIIKKEKIEELDNNINFFDCDNIKLIKKVNNILKEHVYFKIASGNIQQLCNILEDLEYFNLIDDDYNFYYDILNMLKNSCNLFELKNIDYINILNIIKTRNMKYNNFLPISNFSFLFDKIKDLDFDFFTCDHLCELIKILCYFKKCYHLNMCMYKLEACLEKKNFDDIYSTSTLIYLLYDFSQINRNDMIIHSLCKKLYISIINRINKSCDVEKVNDFKYVHTGKNIKTNDKKNAMYKTQFNISIKEYILLLKSIDKLLDKRIITPLCIDEKKLNSFFLDITYKINENPSQISFKCKYKNNDYYDYEMCLYLYQILLLGKLKSRNYLLFLSCLYNVLTLSIHFNIKDVVLCLKTLHHCTHFITKDRYLIFENTLNYFSHLILSNDVILLERKNILMNNIKNNFIKINKNNMNYVEENCNDNIDILNNLYKNINKIIDDNNYMYINKNKANHYLNGSIMTKYNNDEINTMYSNFDYTKIACIDCCNILYYLKKLNYVNKDLINIILKNVYINVSSLKKQKYILRMVNGLSIIKNIDKEFKDFNCIIKKIMFHFFFIQQEHNNNNNNMSQNIKLEESIKLFYLLSKLDMSKKYKNDLITKYILVRLENILEKKKTTINNIILLLYGIKNMYPYRYISLISYVLHCIDDYQTRIHNINRDNMKSDHMNSDNMKSDNMKSDHMNSDNMKSDRMNSDNMNSDNINSDNMNSDNINSDNMNSDNMNSDNINSDHTNEDDVLCSVSFLKSYFSSIPYFIDSWIDNTCSKINQVYIRISQKLFQNFYEHIFLENKMKNEDMICMLIDYVNFSLPYIPYIEKYLDVIHYIIDMHKVVINKDEFITFLLNWKIYIYRINNNDYGDNEETQKLVYKIDECLNMLCKNDNSYNYNDFISLNKSLEKGNKKNDAHNNDDENISLNNKSVYDFSFNKKKIIFLDTDEDNEKDIICKEYNYIDINKLYEYNFNRKIINNINQNKKLQFCIQKEDNEKNKIFKNIINNNNNKNKNILNEFEIILNKYSYCQNNQNDKIEILKNVKLYSFHIKFMDKKKKIIFEFLDEDAYFKEPDNSSIDLLPSVNLRLTLLKKLNFKIITIPFYEWNKCYGRLEKVKSIYQKLLNVTNPQNTEEEYQNFKSDDIFSSIGRYEITKKK